MGHVTQSTKRVSRGILRIIAVATFVCVMSAVLTVNQAVSAHALSGNDFNAGYIIDDANFYDSNAMSQREIQSFLEQNQPGTCGSDLCLKNYAETTPSRDPVRSDNGNLRCGAYAGGQDTAAAIIFKSQQSCGISAKVILVTLQKEQGLISKLSPSNAAMQRAMGYACPDTAPCASTTLGFGNQVYRGALQLNTYKASRFGKQPGTQTIQYSPSTACGSKTFVVSNYATAALYNYTPYTPNDAALANLHGTADCGAYGNRNFWVYYNDWFGGPTGNPQGAFEAISADNNSVTVRGWAVDADVPSAALSVRVSGDGWSQTLSAGSQNSASQGAFAGAGTNHGYSATISSSVGAQSVCVDAINQGLGIDVRLGCKSVTVPSVVTSTTRIAGTDRYDTAVKIVAANFPTPGVPIVYVASGENFPDALSVVPIAAARKAPVLLVTSSSIPPDVASQLNRLRPQRIVIIGGLAAIGASVASALGDVSGEPEVTRVSGIDRYQTSIAIGDSMYSTSAATTAFIATASDFPDAISAAAAAGHSNSPLLLIDSSTDVVADSVSAALKRWGVSKLNIIGGTAAISDGVMAKLNSIAPAIRISGADRYSTSVAVNAVAFPNAGSAYVATGVTFADGLTGGAIAGARGYPVVLSPSTCIPSNALQQLVASKTTALTLLGGTDALGANVAALDPC